MSLLEIDPNSVVAGWIPLILTGLLAIAVYFLFRSMRKQLRNITVPPADAEVDAKAEASEDE